MTREGEKNENRRNSRGSSIHYGVFSRLCLVMSVEISELVVMIVVFRLTFVYLD